MVGGLYMDVCTVISTAWSAVSMKCSVRRFFGVGRVQTEQVTLANMKYVKIASLFYMESMTLSSAHTRIHTHTTCTLTHAFILTHTCTYSLSHTHTHLYFHTCIALHTNYTNEVYALLPSLITRKAHLTSRKTIFLTWKLIKKKIYWKKGKMKQLGEISMFIHICWECWHRPALRMNPGTVGWELQATFWWCRYLHLHAMSEWSLLLPKKNFASNLSSLWCSHIG